MDVDGHYDNLELQQIDDATYEDLNTRPTFQEKDLKMLQSDIRRYKRVGVSVGLLCAGLALLSIAVPLYLCQSNNLTEERDQLQSSFDQLMTRYKKLAEERDCMKRTLCEPHGFTFGDGLCYYISTERKNWEESRQWCRDRQSDLMVIKSKEKQDFVAGFNKRVWLGLTDSEAEGRFKWVDGTPLTTPTYWYPNQPSNKSRNSNATEDCVEFYDGSQPSAPGRGWNDVTCSSRSLWICERVVC